MDKIIFVINPNSSDAITDQMDRSLSCLRDEKANILIECLTITDGPSTIQTQHDVDIASVLVGKQIASLEKEYAEQIAAFVIACFSDPGMHAAREVTHKQVFGIRECGMLTSLAVARQIGVVATLPGAIERHYRSFSSMGLMSTVAGMRALNLGVNELREEKSTRQRLLEVGRQLKNKDGAKALVLGCANMSQYRTWLESKLSLPVIDPTLAAVSIAIGHVKCRRNI
jgi:Asp/Glu/hydantoin racemase